MNFDCLPPELIVMIFKKLGLHDLINLKKVDKRFKLICEEIKINQIFVWNHKTIFHTPYSWFYSNELTYINLPDIGISISAFLYYKSILKLDKNLRKLSIFTDSDFDISILNEFKLLEQLNIGIELSDDCILSLENLKIIEIELFHHSKFRLTLDTSQLFALKSTSNQLNQIVFNYPDKILFYETDYKFYNMNINFNNLQYLKLVDIDNLIDNDILSKFKNLETLDLNLKCEIEKLIFDNLKNNINLMINEKNIPKKSKLQIYFNGVKLINQNQIHQLEWSSNWENFGDNLLEFQIKNYNLLKDNCSELCEINYCNLIKSIKIIPSSFNNKFSCIQNVYANDHIDDEDQFVKFLNSISHLIELKLINCKLTKSFYDQLSNLYDLDELKIEEKDELNINFNFILNSKRLNKFETNQIMCVDTIDKFFQINERIAVFKFKINSNDYIEIEDYGCTEVAFSIKSYFIDNSEEIENFEFDNLNSKEEVILKLKNI